MSSSEFAISWDGMTKWAAVTTKYNTALFSIDSYRQMLFTHNTSIIEISCFGTASKANLSLLVLPILTTNNYNILHRNVSINSD